MLQNEIYDLYSRHLKSIKPLSSGWHAALCPFHDDTTASLNFNSDSGGFKCHACGASGSMKDFKNKLGISPSPVTKPKKVNRTIAATYDYRDADGNLRYQTVRFDPKGFSQRQPNGSGGWTWNLKGVEIIPYNLSSVIAATDIIIAEGERDVNSLMRIGLVAQTSPMGAGKWRSDFNKYFTRKHVIIIPDNDEPGHSHALQVAKSLSESALSIKIVYLDGLPEKGDVSDWIGQREQQGKSAEEIKQELEDVIDTAKHYEPQLDSINTDTGFAESSEPGNTDTNESLPDPLIVIGKTNDGKILIYSKDTRITHIEDRKSINRSGLIDMCGLAFVKQLEANPKTAQANVRDYCDRIIDQARHVMIGKKERRGQGLYRHDDDSLMVVDGQDSFLISRDLSISEIDTPLFGRCYIEYSDLKWFDRNHVSLARTLTQNDALAILKELATTIDDRWTLKHEHDADLIAFSIVASILQGIFSWRPHYYITGKRASGKTSLLKWIADIWGPIVLFREGKISEAGLRQDLGCDSRIVIIDEFEKNAHRQSITELLRTANHKDGGVITKGTQTGKPMHFRIQSSAWLSSIEIGLNEAADRSRYIIFHFKGYKKNVPSISTTQEISRKIYALSLWLWSQGVDRLADEIRGSKDARYTDRSIDNLAPLAAIYALCRGRTDLKNIMSAMLAQNSEALTKNAVEDERELFEAILGSSLQIECQGVGAYHEKRQLTIAQVIESEDCDQWAQTERMGVKISHGKPVGYSICLAQEPLKQGLLKGTKYEHLGLKEILSRIQGAIEGQKTKFAGVNRNMVRIPYNPGEEPKEEPGEDHE